MGYFSRESREHRIQVRREKNHEAFVDRAKRNIGHYARAGALEHGILIESAEGARFFGSARPLPGFQTAGSVIIEPIPEQATEVEPTPKQG